MWPCPVLALITSLALHASNSVVYSDIARVISLRIIIYAVATFMPSRKNSCTAIFTSMI